MSRLRHWPVLISGLLIVAFLFGITARDGRASDAFDEMAAQADGLILAGKYTEAVDTARQLLAKVEQQFGPDHLKTGKALFTLGNTLRWNSENLVAQDFLKRALVIFTREDAGTDSLDTARVLNELGWTSVFTLQLKDSGQYFARSLEIREKFLPPVSLDIATSLEGLAMTEIYASNYPVAVGYAQKSFDIKKQLYPADSEVVIDAQMLLGVVKHRNGDMAEASEIYRKALEIERGRPQPRPIRLGTALGMNAIIGYDKGDFAAAERYSRESMSLFEQAGATNQVGYVSQWNVMAKICVSTFRQAEGQQWAEKVIASYGVSPAVHARDAMDGYNTLSIALMNQNRYADAEDAVKRALVLAEQAFGESSVDVAQMLENLAYLYGFIGRPSEGLVLFDRIITIREALLPAKHALIGSSYGNRAKVLNDLDRYVEAEQDARIGLEIVEAYYGPLHPTSLTLREILGNALKGLGQYDAAAAVYIRGAELSLQSEGANSQRARFSYHNLGLTYDSAGKLPEAEAAYLKSLTGHVAGSVDDAQTRKLLGELYIKMNRRAEGLDNLRAATRIFADALVKTSGSRKQYEGGLWLKGSAGALLQGLQSDASAFEESFETAQWLLRGDTTTTVSQLGVRKAASSADLAQSVRERQDKVRRWQAVSGQMDRFISQTIASRDNDQLTLLRLEMTQIEGELAKLDALLADKYPALTELSNPRPVTVPVLRELMRDDEAFVQIAEVGSQVLVWVVTRDGGTWYVAPLTPQQIAIHVKYLRCGLDYEGSWKAKGSECEGLVGTPYTAADRKAGKPLPFDLAGANMLYNAIFGGAQNLIGGKRLVVVASGALTKLPLQVLVTELKSDKPFGAWQREVGVIGVELQDVDAKARDELKLPAGQGVRITKVVPGGAAERAGLKDQDILLTFGGQAFDATKNVVAWVQGQSPGAAKRMTVQRDGAVVERDVTIATKKIGGWHPLFAEPESLRDVAWLAKSHAVSVLPSASALRSLRLQAKSSQGKRPYFGGGNPLLDGPDDRYARRREAARAMQRCKLRTEVAALDDASEAVSAVPRGEMANVEKLKRISPLPETAEELCSVAQDLGARDDEILLGASFNENEITRLNHEGRLADYRILHFATHGALAGQVAGTSEPGLILTPPEAASVDDDGYLSATEISELELDADWVILSACNTAAGETKDAEALSGLARSFFYAGARALLVSHWYVDSAATVALIKSTTAALRSDPKIGRDEALRRAITSLIGSGKIGQAHPAAWAPFVVVGDSGAAAR